MLWFTLFAALFVVANGAPWDNKIVGGELTTIEQYPYQISLQVYNQHICGGSIVSSRQIVTAAHCTDGMSDKPMRIRAGSSFHAAGGQVIRVVAIEQHAQYNPKTYDFDVSVLTLESDLQYGSGVMPIPLTRVEPSSGVAVVSGWGHTSENGDVSAQLKRLAVPMIPRSACESRLGSRLTNNMICAGFANGGQDACQGDSGGPLAMDGQLVGVVSWGIGCARPNMPGIYTNVARVLSQSIALA